jgi:nucleoside-diphosphate-sugar epimerase
VRILVTGNLGYIGTRLTPRLRREGHVVIGLDAGWFAGHHVEAPEAVDEQHVADLRRLLDEDAGRLESLLARVDAICHLAAISNDPMADVNPAVTRAVNVDASLGLAHEAKRLGVRRFIFMSSCSVYGDAGGDVDERTPPRVLTPYADSKVRMERALMELADEAFWPILLRNATVFGYSPALRLDLLVNGMAAWALATGIVRLMSTGDAFRPQLHLDDLVDVIAAILRRTDDGHRALVGGPINVGSAANNHGMRELAEMVAAAIPGSEVRVDPDAWIDRRSYRPAFDRLGELLPEARVGRRVAASVDELAAHYRRIGLEPEAVRDLRLTRLAQLRLAREAGILDEDLLSRPIRPVAPLR